MRKDRSAEGEKKEGGIWRGIKEYVIHHLIQ